MLQAQWIPIDAVHPDPRNARQHGDRNLAEIRKSLKRFGQQKPIVIDHDYCIRAGNGTYHAAKELGLTEIYAVLSNGERFRCDLARALVSDPDLVAFDEFTSVVDRTVARIGSAAIAKTIRKGQAGITERFVAISCHYDIREWLEPDWVLDMATGTLARGRLQRPGIPFSIRRCQYGAWSAFARHHYLTRELHVAAQCYLGFVEDQPAAFAGILPSIGLKGHRRVSRLVVLPDYQGVGVGRAMLAGVAKLIAASGQVLHLTTSHPAMVRALKAEPGWVAIGFNRHGASPHSKRNQNGSAITTSTGRATASFVYRGGSP